MPMLKSKSVNTTSLLNDLLSINFIVLCKYKVGRRHTVKQMVNLSLYDFPEGKHLEFPLRPSGFKGFQTDQVLLPPESVRSNEPFQMNASLSEGKPKAYACEAPFCPERHKRIDREATPPCLIFTLKKSKSIYVVISYV